MMHIDIKTMTGKTYRLEVDPQESIQSVRQRICGQEPGLSTSQISLIYGRKQLRDYEGTALKRLDDYHIRGASKVHLTPRLSQLLPGTTGGLAKISSDESAKRAQEEWRLKAQTFDFDEDLHIIDPSSHFHLLNQLEQDVVHRSEYFKERMAHDLSSILAAVSDDQCLFEDVGDLRSGLWLKNVIEAIEVIHLREIKTVWVTYGNPAIPPSNSIPVLGSTLSHSLIRIL